MKNILVVGGRNTCGSIVAAGLMAKCLAEKGRSDTAVASAGIMAFPGIPAEEEAVKTLEKNGISGSFCSSALTKKQVEEADLIITMTRKIKEAILAKFPGKEGLVLWVYEGEEAPEEDRGCEKLEERIPGICEKLCEKL
ncbi:MAG TPA: low molecular weight protein arginine phosphatase [Candidatus Goldiibacteriota bacterium]|nr:low molecular weight protein arginine phosphatase [Candidatus Goldiibacteriota bacterium]